MARLGVTLGQKVWDLPPLILHPFNERVAPSDLLESSRAALILSGLIPGEACDVARLERKVLTGRYAEIRMLFYIGKDVMRWVGQSMEQIEGVPELRDSGIQPQSLAGLLTGNPPEPVQAKLKAWGVVDYSAIFSRAIGLNAVFRDPPPFEALSADFLRAYHRCADRLYQYYLESQPHRKITTENFRFQLYASGEYSRMLEAEWGAS